MTEIVEGAQIGMNESPTCTEGGSELTRDCSGFDLDDMRRKLIARRGRAGADTADGHTCSNLVEQLENMRGYVRPDWASDVRQTLPWMIQQQMRRLGIKSAQ